VLQSDNITYITPIEKANALADYFSTVFTAEVIEDSARGSHESQAGLHHHLNLSNIHTDSAMPDKRLDIRECDIFNLLTKLKASTSETPDGIPALFYQRFAIFLAEPLTMIYERSYNDGMTPDLFRETVITPIHKKGAKSCINNYRPIAQSSVASKIFEKLVVKHLSNYLLSNNLVDIHQHGFVPNRSTCTQLLVMTHDWASFINEHRHFHCVYFDQKNAFDKIQHELLLDKLRLLGIHEQTLNWCKSFLSNRSFKVRVDDTLSKRVLAPTGVPQGSCLSPLLYSIFISDIGYYIPPEVSYLVYADDLKLYCPVSSSESHALLQSAVSGVERWCLHNGVLRSPNKCTVLKRGFNGYEYTVNESTLQ